MKLTLSIVANDFVNIKDVLRELLDDFNNNKVESNMFSPANVEGGEYDYSFSNGTSVFCRDNNDNCVNPTKG